MSDSVKFGTFAFRKATVCGDQEDGAPSR